MSAADTRKQTSTATDPIEHETDLGNARRLVAGHGVDLRFCKPWKKWLVWDGQRWRDDATGEVMRRAKATAQLVYGATRTLKHATRSESRAGIEGMVVLAQTEPGMPVRPEDLDAAPWSLNVLNGTLDLRTGQLRDHHREDLLTKLAPVTYDPKAKCSTWLAFLDRVMGKDKELVRFLQRAVGYSLTGSIREQCLFILYGTGANGKSTFLGTISQLLGEYATTTPTETLLVKTGGGGIPNDVARLKGARFVSAIEAEDGRRLAEALIKQMTGGDTMTARFLYGEFFEFVPEFKIFLAVNHKPLIRNTDHAIWRRIRLVPFTVTIPEAERDKDLPEKLRRELPGILAWAVQGCLDWQREGLGMPEAVQKATAEYRAEMDVLDQFLAERCELASTPSEARGLSVRVGRLYEAYERWCDAAGVRFPLTRPALSGRLRDRGFTIKKSNGEWVVMGLDLREDLDTEEDDF
jgi:putative DNA primase/helicase